jgi:hypothetical protein
MVINNVIFKKNNLQVNSQARVFADKQGGSYLFIFANTKHLMNLPLPDFSDFWNKLN